MLFLDPSQLAVSTRLTRPEAASWFYSDSLLLLPPLCELPGLWGGVGGESVLLVKPQDTVETAQALAVRSTPPTLHSLSVGTWLNSSISLKLSFFIYKME